jgi:hypothetical protein
LQERRSKGSVVGIDETEVNLAFVAKAGAVQWSKILVDQRDPYAPPRELECHAGSLEARPEDHYVGAATVHMPRINRRVASAPHGGHAVMHVSRAEVIATT